MSIVISIALLIVSLNNRVSKELVLAIFALCGIVPIYALNYYLTCILVVKWVYFGFKLALISTTRQNAYDLFLKYEFNICSTRRACGLLVTIFATSFVVRPT